MFSVSIYEVENGYVICEEHVGAGYINKPSHVSGDEEQLAGLILKLAKQAKAAGQQIT